MQLTNFILDSGVNCHMTPDISDFVPGSLVETDKYIEVVDGHFFTAKQTGEVQINMHDDNGKLFIATVYNILFAPELCYRFFSIITLINLGHTCLFCKGFCTIFFSASEQNAVTLPHSVHIKTCIFCQNKGKVKITKGNYQKGTLLGTMASDIMKHVHKVTTGWRYCKYLSSH